jgi:hypothetical protein
VGTAPITTQQTFVTGDGGLIAFWVEGTLQSGSLHVRTTSASPGGGFVGVQSLSSGRPGGGQVRFAVNAAGRAAELFPLATSGGTTLKVQLRTPSGTWGSVRTLGLAGRSRRPDEHRRRLRRARRRALGRRKLEVQRPDANPLGALELVVRSAGLLQPGVPAVGRHAMQGTDAVPLDQR